MINKIAVVGTSGTGKSTLGRLLASKLNLPLFHADTIEWLPNWVQQKPEMVVNHNDAWVKQTHWIIEGWIDRDKVSRLNEADLVIDLDYSRWVCVVRNLRRMIEGRHRQELPEGCIDTLDLKFLYQVFLKKERKAIDDALAIATPRLYRKFISPSQTRKWLLNQTPELS